MLLDHVYAFNNDLAELWHCLDDLAVLSFVLAGEDDYIVSFFDMHMIEINFVLSYTISGARDAIV